METEIIKEISEVLDSNKLSLFRGDKGLTEGGPKVQRLEQAFRDYFHIKHAIAFNSATAGLHAACVAVRPKYNQFSVTPFSFTSSVSCVRQVGGIPFFLDIDPKTYCMNVRNIRVGLFTVLIPVHLFGGCADMGSIDIGLWPVIEDAAQAIGSKYKGKFAGTMGDCGVFSFNQSKPISCGEGGMMITNNDDIAYKAKLVRNHGEVLDPDAGIIGYNYRMTEIEAIIAYHRFLKLDEQIAQRQKNVEYFRERIGNIPGVKPMWINPDVDYSWYVYAFEVENNKRVAFRMTEEGVTLRHGYITQPLNIAYGQSCPICEDIWANKIVVTDVIGKSQRGIDIFISTLDRVMSSQK